MRLKLDSDQILTDQNAIHILMIAPQPFFEDRGTPISVLGRIQALSDLGYTVDLVTYPIGEDVSISGLTIFRSAGVPFIKKIQIGPSWEKALLDILLLVKAIQMLRKKKYHLLHTHEEAGFFSIILHKMFRIPHLYDMHSSLPQQLTNFRFFRHPVLVKLFRLLEYNVLRSSDAVITICPALSDYVKQLAPELPQVIIENVPIEKDRICKKKPDRPDSRMPDEWRGKRIILYTGNLESYQGIELLIKCAERVLKKHREVIFLVVGGEPHHIRFYREAVTSAGISANFHFLGKRPYNEIPFYINHCEILISPRIRGTNTPLKIYSYLKSGKPIVATDLYTHTQVLDPDISILVAPEAMAMAQGIDEILSDPEMAKTLGDQAKKLFNSQYSYASFIDKTDEVYKMALKKGSHEKKPPATCK